MWKTILINERYHKTRPYIYIEKAGAFVISN